MLSVGGRPLHLDTDPRPALGAVIEQSHHHETGFPLVAGGGSAVLGLGLLVGGSLSFGTSVGLGVVSVGIGLGLASLAQGLLRDVLRMRAENGRGLRIRYGLADVRVHASDAPERILTLDQALEHPLGDRVPWRLRELLRARAALAGERAESERRLAVELAALHRRDFPEARWVSVAFPESGARIFTEDDAADAWVVEGVSVWRVAAARDGPGGSLQPQLSKRAAQRLGRRPTPG